MFCRYSPMGRGMLTGQVKSYDDIPDGDLRKVMPRYFPKNFAVNISLVNELEELAAIKGCTPAQLAIGWLVTLSRRNGLPTIIPIPGATKPQRVQENAASTRLSEVEMLKIDSLLREYKVVGDRYGTHAMKYVNG